LEPEFKVYSQQVLDNAKIMCDVILSRGIDIVSGKTDNHIILMDLRSKGITGKDSERALGLANITVNKNAVPNDPQSPFVTSGVRLGTPAITTRGFKEKEVSIISNWICDVVLNNDDEKIINEIKNNVTMMCKDFPVYNI
jgi:glycine hydroxymethyltransferase